MKPRIEKKVSKALAGILGNALGKVWVDSDARFDRSQIHYRHNQPNGNLTPRQARQNYQQRVSCNNVPCIGGGVDYWGEGMDAYSVYEHAQQALIWEVKGAVVDDSGWPIIKERRTARWVLRQAHEYAARKSTEAMRLASKTPHEGKSNTAPSVIVSTGVQS